MAGYCFRVAIAFEVFKRPRLKTEDWKNRLQLCTSKCVAYNTVT